MQECPGAVQRGRLRREYAGGLAMPVLSSMLRLPPLRCPPCNTLQNLVRGSSLLPPLGAFGTQRGRSPGRTPVLLCSSAVKLLWDIGQHALLLLTWHLSPSLFSFAYLNFNISKAGV